MKKYLIDQLLFLLIGIVLIIAIPFVCGPIFAAIFEIVVIFCWGYLCRRILLIPLDCFLGKETKSAFFTTQCGIEEYEFFRGLHCAKWKFYFDKNQTLILLVPDIIITGEGGEIYSPEKNGKVKITYYKLSKVLLSWEAE